MNHQPLPRPQSSEELVLHTTSDPQEVRDNIGFTYATVFQDDTLVPGFEISVCQTPERKDTGGTASIEGARTVWNSWVELRIPLATNEVFRRAFQDVDGSARVGRILELMDGLAADVGYRHSTGGYVKGIDISVATASIDSLELNGKEFSDSADILIRAYVTQVGTSSMEVCCDVEQSDTAVRTHAFFMMVARQKSSNTAYKVPKIQDFSESATRAALERAKVRKSSRQLSMERSQGSPSAQELEELHNLWRDNNKAGNGVKFSTFGALASKRHHPESGQQFMSEHVLESTLLIWPNEINVHGSLFGGVLARQAVEVAHMTVAQYLRSTAWASLLAVDDIFFLKPIPCGALIRHVGQVIFTHRAHMVVRVEVLLVPPRQHPAVWERATVFYFHFRWPPVVPEVVPEGYEEYLLYLEGRRRHQKRTKVTSKL